MKLCNVFIFLVLGFGLSIFAMSSDEKIAFKTQLKAVQTSDAMEQLVQGKLQADQKLLLNFGPSGSLNFGMICSANSQAQPIFTDAVRIIEETFFEECHPFLFEGADIDSELAKFAKYEWAFPNIIVQLTPIFNTHRAQTLATDPVTGSAYLINRYNHIRMRCGQVTGEDRMIGGKEQLSRRVFGYQYAVLGAKISQIMLFIGCAAAAVGVLYYLWNIRTEEQDDEGNEEAQEDIKNDSV